MNNRYRAGFTIVELLIYMAIMSILLVVLSNIFTSIIDVRLESESVSAVEQDGMYILSRFTYDIPRAQSITTPASLGASTNSLSIVVDGTAYTYAVNNNNLELTTSSGTDVLNSINTTISGLSFLRLGNSGGNNTIRITYTVTSVTLQNGNPETKQFQTTVGLR